MIVIACKDYITLLDIFYFRRLYYCCIYCLELLIIKVQVLGLLFTCFMFELSGVATPQFHIHVA